jgi:hypothetical protein
MGDLLNTFLDVSVVECSMGEHTNLGEVSEYLHLSHPIFLRILIDTVFLI